MGRPLCTLNGKIKIMTKVVTKMFKDNEIDAGIIKIAKDAETFQQRIHNYAASILKIWHDAGGTDKTDAANALRVDAMHVAVDRINNLQAASPYHSQAFANWVSIYLPFEWSDEISAWYCHQDHANFTGKQWCPARDNPFWKVSPPKKVQVCDSMDKLQKLVEGNKKRRLADTKKRHEDDVLLTPSQERMITDILQGKVMVEFNGPAELIDAELK